MALTKKTARQIEQCDDFVCVVTRHWLASGDAMAQLAHALHLGKPIIALIRSGIRLPPVMTHLLAGAETHAWETPQDLQIIMAMLEGRHPQGLELTPGPVFD